MGRDVIIACDFHDKSQVMDFLSLFKDNKPYVKIGMELFYSEGPEIVRLLKSNGHKVFLDLKLHDIPNTVKKSIKVLTSLGVDMLNVHAQGGITMMKEASNGVDEGCKESGVIKPKLIAVTQLTSIDQKTMSEELLIDRDLKDVVLSYSKNVQKAGLDGVVCSAYEASMIHDYVSPDFVTVTPGIRLNGDDQMDQKRVATPANAKELTSDFIVVGRSITASKDPVKAYERCIEDFIK